VFSHRRRVGGLCEVGWIHRSIRLASWLNERGGGDDGYMEVRTRGCPLCR
jgi:hypothetical protein